MENTDSVIPEPACNRGVFDLSIQEATERFSWNEASASLCRPIGSDKGMEGIVLVAGVCHTLVLWIGMFLGGSTDYGGSGCGDADLNCAASHPGRLYGEVACIARAYKEAMKYRYGSIQETCFCIREISPRLI